MSEEYSLDRVDALHDIAAASAASNEKDPKQKRQLKQKAAAHKDSTQTPDAADDGLNVSPETHVIDFEA